MKKTITATLILALLFLLSSCGWLFGDEYNFNYASPEKYSVGDARIENASSLSQMHISWYSGNITVKTHSEDSILIEEESAGVSDDDHKVHYRYTELTPEGGVLFVNFGKSGVSDYDGVVKNLTITVPQNDDYYIGITAGSANVTVDTSDYENMLDKLSITTINGAVHASVYDANIVQIAGYNVESDDTENKIYELNAVGKIYSLGINSSYAKVSVTADEVLAMDRCGSALNDTYLKANKAGDIELFGSGSEFFIDVKEFNSIEVEARDKPVHITLPEGTGFTLNKTRVTAFVGEDEPVSEKVEIGFDGVIRESDTKYVVGDGEKIINITTYNDIEIRVAE